MINKAMLPALPVRPRNFTDPVPNPPFRYEDKPMLRTGAGSIEVRGGLEFNAETSTLSAN